MGLSSLTHERFARLRDRGELPDDVEREAVSVPAPEPSRPTRGGTSHHPTWPRVLALVRNTAGTQVDHDFVAEAPRLSEAIRLASRYPYRAIVVTKSGKRVFDNGREIEVGEVR